MSSYTDQQLENYLMGKFLQKEREQLEKQVLNDKELADRLNSLQKTFAVIDGLGDQEMMGRIRSIHEKEKKRAARSAQRRLIFWGLAAIAFLIIALLFWKISRPVEPAVLYAQHYAPYELSFTSRDAGTDAMLAQAGQSYSIGQYAEAIPLFEKILTNDPKQSKVELALAICQLEVGATNQARQHLLQISSRDFDLYKDHSNWYLALIALSVNKPEEAKSLLNYLLQDSSSHFFSQAQDLSDQL